MIIDGKAVARDRYKKLAPRYAALGRAIHLGIIVVGENPVIESFVRIKTRSAEQLGIEMVRVNLPESSTTEEVVAAVRGLAERTDALIVQLPLPKQVDTDAVLSAIPSDKDVDALNPAISESERMVHAPVALAVVELLKKGGVEIRGKRTVVVGAGRLVGRPAQWLLMSLGAEVSMFTLEEGSIEDLKDADIIVSGAGNPGMIRPEHIRAGVALIDAGTSEQGKKIRGDATESCAEKAAVFTPVPGGVGPVAVAMIFRNLLTLVEA
ncbi:MAG: bifunctional 5,10-methylenetetrahydrofolate dehydrogenase/5,10-methenyltetrahydrofolate cyclohydrolase [bacterium]|nr:bifunctional 5,10-methylenetetrahydrofolate dehydrogenase/5,10-methenyltetrahydrofolate cyclohydrolase [bacterium]